MSSPYDPRNQPGSNPSYERQQHQGDSWQQPPGAPQGPVIHVHADSGNNTSLAPVTSLVTGLLGLFTAWIPILGVVAWVFAPLALIFGVLGLRRGKSEHKIMSILGIVAGAIALLVCFGYLAALVGALASSSN